MNINIITTNYPRLLHEADTKRIKPAIKRVYCRFYLSNRVVGKDCVRVKNYSYIIY